MEGKNGVVREPPAVYSAALEETLERIEALRERGERWNGYDVAAPNPAAIGAARKWLEALYSEITRSGRQ